MAAPDRMGGIGREPVKRRHHLPHWQFGGSTYFLTFRSARGPLPDSALHEVRTKVFEGHGLRYDLAFGVLMPDHVHLMLRPSEREPGLWWDLATVLQGIKGGSARRINQVLRTNGTVWQKETFDRVVRDQAEFEEKWNYMLENPLRAGLIDDPDRYVFFIDPNKGVAS